jgi:hypothetical protein
MNITVDNVRCEATTPLYYGAGYDFATQREVYAGITNEAWLACPNNLWQQQSGDYNGHPGCGTALAVSANNQPVVIGCGGGTGTVYYQSPSNQHCTTGGGFKTCVPEWTAMSTPAQARYIADDLNGDFWMTDASGTLWASVGTGTGNGGAGGSWKQVATTAGGVAACTASIASAYLESTPEQVVYEVPAVHAGSVPTMWGVSCSGTPEYLPFNFTFTPGFFGPLGPTAWEPYSGTSASQITVFTDIEGTSINQNPWVVQNGNIFYAQGESLIQQTNAPANVTYATDHYIVAGGNVYYWNGSAAGDAGHGSTTWTYVIGATPSTAIKQIAWAQAVPGTVNGTIGPSALWAIDTNGALYYMYKGGPPPR